MSRTISYGFLAPCKNIEKINDKILRKRTEGQKDGRTDRLYFIRPFRLPPGVQKSRKKPDTKQLKIYA